MTKIKELISILEKTVPLSYQESWDNCGLIVGEKENKITSVLLSLDVTEDVVDEAIQLQANIIIAHHPIIFKGLKSLTGKNYVERTVIKAIKNDIAIYAMHTNLDNYPQGVSYKMAQKLSLKNISNLDIAPNNLKKLVVFVPNAYADKIRTAIFDAGAGHIGNYDQCSYNVEGKGTFRPLKESHAFVGQIDKLHHEKETRIETIFPSHIENELIRKIHEVHPYEEVAYDIYHLNQNDKTVGLGKIGELEEAMNEVDFLQNLKNTFQLQNLRHTPLLGKKIKKVAVCGGSCSFLIQKAKHKADIFITADVKYHEFFDAENDLVIADIGHFESEQYSKDIFYDIISKNFSNFAVHFSEINTNPINYL